MFQGILHGMNNPYSILCESFMSQVFNEDDDTGHYNKYDQRDMIQVRKHFYTLPYKMPL